MSVNDLPWKASQSHLDIGGFGPGDEAEGGMLTLEEVEDVEVVYGKSEGGKVVGFKVSASSRVLRKVNLTKRAAPPGFKKRQRGGTGECRSQ